MLLQYFTSTLSVPLSLMVHVKMFPVKKADILYLWFLCGLWFSTQCTISQMHKKHYIAITYHINIVV